MMNLMWILPLAILALFIASFVWPLVFGFLALFVAASMLGVFGNGGTG